MKKQIVINDIVTIVSSIEELEALNLSIKNLAEVYNELAKQPVSKFADKKVALKRAFEILPEYVEPAPEPKAEEQIFVHEHLIKLGLIKKAPKAAHTTRGKYNPGDVITILSPKNPKRPETQAFATFSKYQDGMTVEQALSAGIPRADLSWDNCHGFIRIAPKGAEA